LKGEYCSEIVTVSLPYLVLIMYKPIVTNGTSSKSSSVRFSFISASIQILSSSLSRSSPEKILNNIQLRPIAKNIHFLRSHKFSTIVSIDPRFESPKILTAINSMNIPISESFTALPQPPTQATSSPYLCEDDVLRYDKDKYKGVIVDCSALPSKLEDFIFQLNYSLQHWKVIGRRGVWLKIPIEKSHFIAPAVDMGFCFHHAEKEYLMLNYWLSPEENRMPPNASHQVGVGSVVILGQGSNKKLLLVQEKSGPLRGSGIWKLPTGLVEQGEDISAAAEREVLEETGIHASFAGLLCFRHAHNALFGKSDLFFLCLLKPK